MAVMYRCDLQLIGGSLKTYSLIRNRLVSKTYNAVLEVEDEQISCIATLYPGRAYKIDSINDNVKEQEIYDRLISCLRNEPKLLFGYLLRTMLKVMALLGIGIFAIMLEFSLYKVSHSTGYPLLNVIYCLTGFLGSVMIKYLLNFV